MSRRKDSFLLDGSIRPSIHIDCGEMSLCKHLGGATRATTDREARRGASWATVRHDDAVYVAGDPALLAGLFACFDLPPPRVQLHAR